ncbi:MAG: hypothetical protein IT381_10955 [Deltaproteobacteria bacterium]|nr:hypothetical protein [Deltaproteobacteria bacterium]
MDRATVTGISLKLPATVRDNTFWSAGTVERWMQKPKRSNVLVAEASESLTAWQRRIVEEMAAANAMPFLGTKERRVFKADESIVEFELSAARAAMADAGIAPQALDFLISYSAVPEYLHTTGNGPLLHRELGLRPDARTIFVEAACNSFQAQLDIADMLIATGQGKLGLLTQSAAASRVLDLEDPASLLFGDGASAAVVGRAADGFGVLSSAHLTDGSVYGGTVTSVPGRRWYEAGAVVFHANDRALGRKMLLSIADAAEDVSKRALAKAGVSAKEIRFFAGHQAVSWVQRIMQEAAGVAHAKRVDTFPYCGTLTASNLPASLSIGAKEGLLREGDLVLLCSGASGQTLSSTVMRWGGARK